MEIGKWYKDGQSLFCLTKDSDISAMGYGFDAQGIWHDECEGWICQEEATKEEIESALIKEAQRRGYTKDNHDSLIDSGDKEFTGWYYSDIFNRLYTAPQWCGGSVVFDNGQWAEIVEDSIEHLKSKIDYCGDVVSEHITKPEYTSGTLDYMSGRLPIDGFKPTITVLDIDRKELGKIYRTNNKYYLHIGNEIVECSSVEDCLIKTDNFYA